MFLKALIFLKLRMRNYANNGQITLNEKLLLVSIAVTTQIISDYE